MSTNKVVPMPYKPLTQKAGYSGAFLQKRIFQSLVAAAWISATLAVVGPASADYIVGPGVGIASATTYDSGGTRTNIALSSPITLPAGNYQATNFSFIAGAIGDVMPFLAILTSGTLGSSNETFQVIAEGRDNNISSSAGYGSQTTGFGGTNTFDVPAGGETIFAGITGTQGNNPVPLAYTGWDAHNPPAFPIADFAPSNNLPAFAYPGLTRQYAFSIGLVSVPSPSAGLLILCGALGGLVWARRKGPRKNKFIFYGAGVLAAGEA